MAGWLAGCKEHEVNDKIKVTNAETGDVSHLVINKSLNVGDSFRLIGRSVTFIATRITKHKVVGMMVTGLTADNRYGTTARICDTAAA